MSNFQFGSRKRTRNKVTCNVTKADISKKKPRQRYLSGSSIQSIPGSVELDGLYCRNISPVQEEFTHKVAGENVPFISEDAHIKVTNWKNSNETPKISSRNKRKRDEFVDDIIELSSPTKRKSKIDIFEIDSDSSIDQSSFVVKVSKQVKSTKCKGALKSPNTIDRFMKNITSFKNKSHSCAKLTTKKSSPASKSLTFNSSNLQFVMDDSDDSVVGANDIDGSMVTNLSYNFNNTSLSTPISQVIERCKTSDKRTQNKARNRTLWPLDYTQGHKTSVTPSTGLGHWSPHMVAFYDSDISEDFDLDRVHKKMPSKIHQQKTRLNSLCKYLLKNYIDTF